MNVKITCRCGHDIPFNLSKQGEHRGTVTCPGCGQVKYLWDNSYIKAPVAKLISASKIVTHTSFPLWK